MELVKKAIMSIISCTFILIQVHAHSIPGEQFLDEKSDKEASTFEFSNNESIDCHIHQSAEVNGATLLITITSINGGFIVLDESLGIDNKVCSLFENDQNKDDIFIKCDDVTALPGNVVYYQLGFPYGRVINPVIGPIGEFHCY